MKIRWRSFVTLTLTLILVLQPTGIFCTRNVMKVEAASMPPTVNEAIVTERIKELAKLLEINEGNLNDGLGRYFTKDGKQCTTHGTKLEGVDCTNCKNSYVISSYNWFEPTFGYTVNINCLPGHNYPNNGMGYPTGNTCHGFVNFVLWFIARDTNTSKVEMKLIGTSKEEFTVSNLKALDVRIGDVIRTTKGHSFVFLSYVDSDTIKVLDCNGTAYVARTAIRTIDESDNLKMAISRATNYEPDYNASLPDAMTSSTSAEAKTNIINYATSLVGYNRTKFVNVGRTDIPSGDWCTWFLKLCGERVGIGNLFSSSAGVSSFCTDMIQNYGAEAFYYTDSSYLTSADKTKLSGATAVTKSTFTPQKGDIYILHETGYDDFSQVGFVMDVVDGTVMAVVGNNGTAGEVQTRTSTTNYFYQLTNSGCPIIGYIRPNYQSLDEIPLTSISLDKSEVNLQIGQTTTLKVSYNPTNTTENKAVNWTSSNTSVATVSSSGVVTAVGNGTAKITATTVSGSKTATCMVTVSTAVSGVSLDKSSATLTSKGATVTLTPTISPSNAADKTVSWKSSNTSVATVSSNGVVTAIGNGTATITVTTNSGGKTATCKVTVNITPTGVTLNKTTATLTSKGATVSLVATVTPSEAADKTVSWKSSNTSVATVDSKGVVTAVGHGTAIVTATTNSGGKTATCKVTVQINGLIKDSDGIWRYYKDGVVNTGYIGLVSYAGKNWYVQNGVLNSSYTNVVKIDGVYHYIKGGQFMSDYTGLASNANGTWYMQNGLLDFGYTNVVAINGVYHYIKGGQFMSDYTGLASNTNGTWYMQKGVLNLSFSDIVKTDGKWRYIQNGKYMSDYTGVAKSSDGNWYYIEKGVFNPSYTGLASNTNGTWYMQKGVLDFKFTDIVKTNGKWCYVKEGQFMSGYTGVAKCSDGNWYYIEKGVINPNYTGLASNDNGIWYMQKGVLHFSYTNVVKINGIYHYIKGGQFMSDYTGLASNANGTWYMQKGVLDLNFSDVVKTDGKWRYIKDGKYMSDYTGVAKSSDGNWYYIEKGVFNPSYTGLASNANGTWYMQKGVLNFAFTDIVKTNGKWCYIKEGQFMSDYTGVAKSSDGNWYYIENGVFNQGYTGLASNANGTWYMQKGVLNFKFTDIVKTNGKWCYIKEGQFMSSYTGVARCSDGNWYYIEKGIINPNYTGLSTNANGTWYVQKGFLDFKFSGSIIFKGITYKIVEGKVV